MIPRSRLSVLTAAAGDVYAKLVLATAPADLVAYWPLSEGSGSVVNDESGHGLAGSYSGALLGQAGIGDGRTCPWFDGVNDNCNVFSAGLASAWDWSEFSVAQWVRMNAASVWSDGANRNWVVLSGGNNYLWLRKISTANMIQVCAQYNGTGRWIQYDIGAGIGGDWFHVCLTSKAGSASYRYVDGATAIFWATVPSPSSDALTAATIASASSCHHGWLAHVALWGCELTAAQVAALAAPP